MLQDFSAAYIILWSKKLECLTMANMRALPNLCGAAVLVSSSKVCNEISPCLMNPKCSGLITPLRGVSRVTGRFEKNCPIFQKSSPNLSKKAKMSTTKLNLNTKNIYIKPLLKP